MKKRILFTMIALFVMVGVAFSGFQIGDKRYRWISLTSEGLIVRDNSGNTMLTIDDNGLRVGDGTPDVTMDGEDLYVEGTLEVDGASRFDGAATFNSDLFSTSKLTAGSGTGVTVDDVGSLRTQVYKVTVDYTQFDAAAVTHDLIIATMPAKTIIHSVIADVTAQFVCASVCTTGTLSATLGITAGGVEFLESFDIDAAAATFGDADSEVGDKIDVAANTNGGYVHWAGTTIVMRGTSGTGNWGDGAGTTNLNAGSVTFYILYSVLP